MGSYSEHSEEISQQAKTREQSAREMWLEALSKHERGEGAFHSPTTYSDCAALHDNAALAYKVAAALGNMGYFDAAASYAAQGDALAEAGASCDLSAAGKTIEV